MIPAERAHLNVAAVSHPGVSGKNNEDRYSVSSFLTPQNPPQPSLLAIVADGIGGHRAGEIAAELAIETISQNIAASDASHPPKTLQEAIQHASRVIYQQAESNPNQRGMGSTCACCWVIGDRLFIASVGDSRVYLIRNGAIQQLSTDHTWVQEAIDQGALAPGQARNHPNAHVIRRYLGSRQPAIPDLRLKLNHAENDLQAETNQGFTLRPGDRVLLCSDGLTDLVEDREILSYLQDHPLETALNQLVALSNQRGGYDNITIIGLQIPASSPSPGSLPSRADRQRSRAIRRLRLAVYAILAALLVGSFSWGYLKLTASRATDAPASSSSPVPALLPGLHSSPTPALGISSSPSPTRLLGATPTLYPTSLAATLTPWPTNTLAP
jgi:protein phosphatase